MPTGNQRQVVRPGSLHPDEPIEKKEQDLLDRTKLVETVAGQILAIKHAEPITVGLNAAWGVGKTSFVNLLRQQILSDTAEDTHPPIIIRFNPWYYGNVEELIRAFFTAIGQKLNSNTAENVRTIAGQLLDDVGPIVESLFPLVPAGTSKWMGKKLLRAKTIPGQRKSIDDALKGLPARLVVFVDDIDRLEPDVTKVLFRMVRLIANFKNTTYVLAFDRTMVEQHLAHDKDGSGREYLEKIIHVSYDIPRPQPEVLRHLLRHELNDVRSALEAARLENNAENSQRPGRTSILSGFDSQRYKLIFMNGFADHFTTVRSIKRYVNALRLALPPVAGQVDLVDFCVVELMRLFYPELYERIALAKEVLVVSDHELHKVDGGRRRKALNSQPTEWLAHEVLKALPSGIRRSLERLLCGLFPDLAGIERRRATRRGWSRDQRVCSYCNFDRYFLLSVPSDQLPDTIEKAIDKALTGDNLQNGELLQKCIRGARKRGKIRGLLEAIEDRVSGTLVADDAKAADDAKILAKVICSCDMEDDFQLSDRWEDRVALGKVVHACVARQDRATKGSMVLDVIEHGKSLFTVVNALEYVFNEGVDIQGGTATINELKGIVETKIRRAAQDDDFWDGKRWCYLLDVAGKFGEQEKVAAIIQERLMSEEGLLVFCESFADVSGADEGGEAVVDSIRRWVGKGEKERLQAISDRGGDEGDRACAQLQRLGGECV